MTWQVSNELSVDSIARPGEVVWLQGRSDQECRAHLVELSAAAQSLGLRAWTLDLAFQGGGPWAGVRDFLEDLVSRLPEDLVARHGRELAPVLPALRRSLDRSMLTLMESAPEEERVRGYPQDRAMRVVQGLVDLVGAWASREAPERWLLLCDRFDEAGSMVRTFLRELDSPEGRGDGAGAGSCYHVEPRRGRRTGLSSVPGDPHRRRSAGRGDPGRPVAARSCGPG